MLKVVLAAVALLVIGLAIWLSCLNALGGGLLYIRIPE